MRSHPPIIPARYAQGLAAYRAGRSIHAMVGLADEIEAMHEQPDVTEEMHDEIAASPSSLMMGFADGLLEDIRLIAAARRGQRA